MRAALVLDVALVVHQVDDRMVRRRGPSRWSWRRPGRSRCGRTRWSSPAGRGRARGTGFVLARVPGGGDLALEAPVAEAAGDDDAVEVVEPTGGEQALDLSAWIQSISTFGAVVEPGVLEALDHRQVGVRESTYLPIRPIFTGFVAASTLATNVLPGVQIRAAVEAQHVHTTVSRPSSCRISGSS